jgi:hypothetical protein
MRAILRFPRRQPIALLAPVVVVCCFLLPAAAFGQAAAPAAEAPPTLTTATAVVTILSLLLGFLTQAIQNGKIFGQIVTPKAWLPGLTIAWSFLSAFVAYLTSLQPFVLSATTIFYAVVAGIISMTAGAAPGMAVHAHYVVPGQRIAMRLAAAAATAKGAGKPPEGTPPPAAPSGPSADAPAGAPAAPPAAAMTGRRHFGIGLFAILVLTVCLLPGIVRPTTRGPQALEAPPFALVASPELAQGCSWFQGGGGSQTEIAFGQLATCVVAELLQGISNPTTLLQACGNLTMQQLLSILDSLLNYYTAADGGAALTDASPGAPASAICGAGSPPIMGAPRCATAGLLGTISSARISVGAMLSTAGAAH